MTFTNKELSLIGAALYVCEGTKQREVRNHQKIYSIEFTNTDPKVILLFLIFLRKVINPVEERIKAELFLYHDLNEETLIEFWSNTTNIPRNRFNKSIYLKGSGSKFKHNPLGAIKIRYHHKEHFSKLQGIIDRVFGGVA